MKLFGGSGVDKEELMDWVDMRYNNLQDKISDADMDEYEDQLRIVGWKDRQAELMLLVDQFDLEEDRD